MLASEIMPPPTPDAHREWVVSEASGIFLWISKIEPRLTQISPSFTSPIRIVGKLLFYYDFLRTRHTHVIYHLDEFDYVTKTKGTCPSGNEFSLRECFKIRDKNGWEPTSWDWDASYGESNVASLPYGCIYTGSAHVTFNTYKNSATPCSSYFNCLCKKKRKGNVIELFSQPYGFYLVICNRFFLLLFILI